MYHQNKQKTDLNLSNVSSSSCPSDLDTLNSLLASESETSLLSSLNNKVNKLLLANEKLEQQLSHVSECLSEENNKRLKTKESFGKLRK